MTVLRFRDELAPPPATSLNEPRAGFLEVLQARRARLLASRDPCLVEVTLLIEAMASFLEDWNLHHPQIAGQWGLDPDAPIPLRGTEWLALETGLDEEFVRDIRRGHVRVVELVVFDRLSAAMDCPHLIHDRRVQVLHRPRAAVAI